MKYIKEKPTKAEPRVFESAKRMPKGLARNAINTVNSRSGEKSADRSDVSNHSDPIQQANDKSVEGAWLGANKTAEQAGDSMKAIHRQFRKARQTRTATRSAAKGSGSSIKAAAKVTNRGIQAAKRAIIESIRTSIRVAKIAIKATIAAAKATAAAVKGLVSLVAAGGWVAVVIILAVAVIGWLLASPLSIFMTRNEGQTKSVQSVIAELSQETADEIEEIRQQQGTNRAIQIIYEGSEDGSMIQNGADIIAVYSVRVSMDEENPAEPIVIDDTRERILRDTYHRMVKISYQIIAAGNTAESGAPNKGEDDTLKITVGSVKDFSHI